MSTLIKIAAELGCTSRWLSQLIAEGHLPNAPRGRHDLETMRVAYAAYLASKEPPAATDDMPGKEASTARRVFFEAELLRLRYEREVEQVVLVEDVATVVCERYARIRERLERVALDVADKWTLRWSPVEAKAAIDDAVTAALTELSSEACARVKPEYLVPDMRRRFLAREAR